MKYHQNYLIHCKFELLHYFTHQFICHHTLQKASSIPKNYKHQVFSWKWQVRYMKTFAYAYFIKCCRFITIWEWLKKAAEENIFFLFHSDYIMKEINIHIYHWKVYLEVKKKGIFKVTLRNALQAIRSTLPSATMHPSKNLDSHFSVLDSVSDLYLNTHMHKKLQRTSIFKEKTCSLPVWESTFLSYPNNSSSSSLFSSTLIPPTFFGAGRLLSNSMTVFFASSRFFSRLSASSACHIKVI